MTLNDARRVVMGVIGACGGVPRTQRLTDVFKAFADEAGGGKAPSQEDSDDFDVSDMEDYFEKPFSQAQDFANKIFAAVNNPNAPKPPVPTLDHMTAFYTLYVIDGGIVE